MRINRWMDVHAGYFWLLPEAKFMVGWPSPWGARHYGVYFSLGWGQWVFNLEVLFSG